MPPQHLALVGCSDTLDGRSLSVLCHSRLPPEALGVNPRDQAELAVNGETKQKSNTADMIFPVAEVVSYLSQFMTLLPGDVVITGTPQGVGLGMKPHPQFLRRGDVMTLSAGPLGTQRQRVV